MKITVAFFTSLAVFLIFSCGQNHQDENAKVDPAGAALTADTNVVKVYVDNAGILSADGQAVTLPELDSVMKNLKSKNGTVYYSRDNINADPPEASMQAIAIVAKYELPLKFFTDKTFTEAVKLK